MSASAAGVRSEIPGTPPPPDGAGPAVPHAVSAVTEVDVIEVLENELAHLYSGVKGKKKEIKAIEKDALLTTMDRVKQRLAPAARAIEEAWDKTVKPAVHRAKEMFKDAALRLGDGETESSTDAAGTHSTTNVPTIHSPLARDVGADGAGAGIAVGVAAADSAMLPVELSDVARGAAAADPSMEAGGGELSEEEAAVALAVIQRDAKEQIQVIKRELQTLDQEIRGKESELAWLRGSVASPHHRLDEGVRRVKETAKEVWEDISCGAGQLKQRVTAEALLLKETVKRKMQEKKLRKEGLKSNNGAGFEGNADVDDWKSYHDTGAAAAGGTGCMEGCACVVCFEGTKNAAIIHGEDSHVCCCMECAKRLKSEGMPCPICRKPIDMVVKHYS